MSTEIVVTGSRTLAECEAIIERGVKTFVEVGEALLEIRGRRLYRDAGFKDFDAYCREKWGWGRVHAHRHIQAAKVARLLPSGLQPNNERQARELVKAVDLEEVRAVAAEASTNGNMTAAKIKAAVQKRHGGPAKPKIPKVRVQDFATGAVGGHNHQLMAQAMQDIRSARQRLDQTREVPGIVTRLEGIEHDLLTRLGKEQATIRREREAAQQKAAKTQEKARVRTPKRGER